MKKGVVIIILFLYFSSFVLAPIFAHIGNFETSAASSDASPSAKKEEKVQYDLPYPGILPDNPLYPLKAFRDRIISFLVSSPLKKTEFYIHNSDKRILAGLRLIEKDKDELGASTISKSNNYFYNALSSIEVGKKRGEQINPLLDKMLLSAKKHKEVLQMAEKIIDSKYKSGLQTEEARLSDFEKRIAGLK